LAQPDIIKSVKEIHRKRKSDVANRELGGEKRRVSAKKRLFVGQRRSGKKVKEGVGYAG